VRFAHPRQKLLLTNIQKNNLDGALLELHLSSRAEELSLNLERRDVESS
jgi:hypothetical protein